jgi:hypothetical protein
LIMLPIWDNSYACCLLLPVLFSFLHLYERFQRIAEFSTAFRSLLVWVTIDTVSVALPRAFLSKLRLCIQTLKAIGRGNYVNLCIYFCFSSWQRNL